MKASSGTRALCRCADPGPGHVPGLGGACRPFWARTSTKHSLVGWGGLGGATSLLPPQPQAQNGVPTCPSWLPVPQQSRPRSTRSPNSLRLLSQTAPPQPRFADMPHGALAPLESSCQQLGVFCRQQQWGSAYEQSGSFSHKAQSIHVTPAVRCHATEALRGSLWSHSPSADGRALSACKG